MKKVILTMAVILSVAALFAQPSATELLKKVDDNEVYETIQYKGNMIIDYNRRRYVKEMTAYARGNAYSYMEFTNPEDAGTKYLKRENRLYVYSPDTEQVMPISGHMLQESMMNSDLSYEDSIENETLSARYTPSLGGSDSWDGKDCWILDLSAKKKTESYPKRKLWIDKATGDVLHYELFAPSGAKLKDYTLTRIEVIGGLRFPCEFEMRDLRRKNSKTSFVMKEVKLNVPINDRIFSTQNLERN
ncbi:MAG: outer membrane lipoprotein-sorting protein [Spirochaetaceae bacterium]|jgi:outer membrane lipoprotein-sorting protein|nr:outer membrane lipoprotein-sorting protein [Spirochaetaceae bacterium]